MVALGYIFNDGFSGLHEDVCPEVEWLDVMEPATAGICLRWVLTAMPKTRTHRQAVESYVISPRGFVGLEIDERSCRKRYARCAYIYLRIDAYTDMYIIYIYLVFRWHGNSRDTSAQDSLHIQHLWERQKIFLSISTTDRHMHHNFIGAPSQTKTDALHGWNAKKP